MQKLVLQVKRYVWMIPVISLLLALAGCGADRTNEREGTTVEFTVTPMLEVPEELAALIEENKKDEIRMTYSDGEDLYLVRGYGEQKTGGYSISVKSCTEDEETIWLDTQLLGPQSQEKISKDPSYPCLVIKMEMREKEVMIQ